MFDGTGGWKILDIHTADRHMYISIHNVYVSGLTSPDIQHPYNIGSDPDISERNESFHGKIIKLNRE